MSYLAVELDALNAAPSVARGGGIPEDSAIAGLLRMWAHCFRNKTDHVSTGKIAGWFGGEGYRVASALTEFGFLEKLDEEWRVRGATRYLRVSAARSKGGHASKGNLIPGARQRKEILSAALGSNSNSLGSSREAAETQPSALLGSLSALSPNTEHRTPKEETTTLSGKPTALALLEVEASTDSTAKKPAFTAREAEVFDHWRKVMGKPSAIFNGKRVSAVRARFAEGYESEVLKAAVDGCARTPHNMGQNDRGHRYDDLELICRNGAQVERFAANAATSPALPKFNPDTHWPDGERKCLKL